MLNQVITLYQLTHSLISLYKQRTENLCKLENAEVVRGIPELDASLNVDDGVVSKTRLEGTVEIKVTLANMVAYAILVNVWAFC